MASTSVTINPKDSRCLPGWADQAQGVRVTSVSHKHQVSQIPSQTVIQPLISRLHLCCGVAASQKMKLEARLTSHPFYSLVEAPSGLAAGQPSWYSWGWTPHAPHVLRCSQGHVYLHVEKTGPETLCVTPLSGPFALAVICYDLYNHHCNHQGKGYFRREGKVNLTKRKWKGGSSFLEVLLRSIVEYREQEGRKPNDNITGKSQHTRVMRQASKNHKISKQNDIFVLSSHHLISESLGLICKLSH